ncbi:MAG: hypothetical protein JO272_00125 [Pseudonocardiales bacterium]|nr:hypothetical protein [Pseudonocardiales bacterium]
MAPEPDLAELDSTPLRDVAGTPIRLHSRVEQVAVDENHGAPRSQLHMRGQVIGWGTHLLYVRFEPGNRLTALRPYHVRVLDAQGDY